MKGKILRYSITIGICLVLTFVIACISGLFSSWEDVKANTNWNVYDEFTKNMFLLTNASFTIGVICAGVGLLVFAANAGAFEFIVYGIRRFFSIFQRDPSKVRFKTYADYHAYKSGAPNHPFLYLVIVGVLFIGFSFLFLTFYQNNVPTTV